MTAAGLRQWHEDPQLIAAAATPLGRVAICVAAAVLLGWLGAFRVPSARTLLGLIALVIPAVTLWPGRRRELLSVASAVAVFDYFRRRNLPALDLLTPESWAVPAEPGLRFFLLAAGLLVGLSVFVNIAGRLYAWPAILRRYPVAWLHITAWLVLLAIPAVPLLGVAAEILPLVLWRLSYSLRYFARPGNGHARLADHLFYLWPVAGIGRFAPVGKGLDYLARHEAGNAADLARSQLAGLKLLGLAVAWTVAVWLIDAFLYGDAKSPAYAWFGGASLGLSKLTALLGGQDVPIGERVAGLFLNLIRDTTQAAAIGHLFVGCFRLFGFRIFRDVYRPLVAQSIVDFWNRRTWYFKELMTDLFFYPTFLSASFTGPRLRLLLAVMAAAGFGNFYFHLLYFGDIEKGGYAGILDARMASHAVYCLLLATGIWLSMLRQQASRGDRPRGGSRGRRGWRRLRAIAGVWIFYAFVHLWSGTVSDLGPLARLRWLLAGTAG